MNVRAVFVMVLVLAATSTTAVYAATSLQAITGVVGGKGGGGGACGSLGGAPEADFFVGSVFQIDNAGIGSCGYSGGITTNSGTAGTVLNAASLAPVGVDFGDPTIQFDGTASARAALGSLGAAAHAHLNGLTANGIALFSSIGIATFSDDITAVSGIIPGGSDGFLRYHFHIDGSLSALGPAAPFDFGDTFAAVSIQQGSGPTFGIFNATTRRGSLGTINNAPPPLGWTNATGSLSGGSDFVTFDLPMVWGSAALLKVGLLASAYGTSDTLFASTAKLTGVEALDANHNLVADFTLRGASGTDYLHLDAPPPQVPETPTVLMMLLGLGGVLGGARRKAR